MNAGSASGRWFFFSLASVLLLIVAVGFARSFYLRPIFAAGRPGIVTLPAYIVWHGIALTLWFLLFLFQTLLSRSGRVRLHRSLGAAGVALAAVVFGLSMFVVVRSVVRETSLVVLGDMALLIMFAILIGAGVRFRRKPEVHKRLMASASISIVAPAIARWPGALAWLPLSVLVPQFVLFFCLIGYDLISRRRIHPGTAWGMALYLVAVGISIPVAMSGFGRALIESLK